MAKENWNLIVKTQYEYSILCNIIINQGFEINHRCIPPVY